MYTLKYVKQFENEHWSRAAGHRWAVHDISMKQWRLKVTLEGTAYWQLSVFFREDGTFLKFSLDYEAEDDSHYEFTGEERIRDLIYKPGDERLLFDEILTQYIAVHGGWSALELIRPFMTAQFHY